MMLGHTVSERHHTDMVWESSQEQRTTGQGWRRGMLSLSLPLPLPLARR